MWLWHWSTAGGGEPGVELHGGVGPAHHSQRCAEPAQVQAEGHLHGGGPHLHGLWPALWQGSASSGDTACLHNILSLEP